MPRASKDDKKLLATLRERYKRATEADRENRRAALEDMKFLHVPGEQWDANVRQERGTRPCLEFNKLRVSVKRVVNDMRANRPSGKVRPTEDADKPTAQALEGLIRNIWANSDGDSTIDQAAEYQVGGGMGAWRVSAKYSRDDAWDQDLVIEAIQNPYNLYADPAAKDPLKRDAEFWFLTSRMSKTAYETKYPKAEVVDFEAETEFDDEEWFDDDSVRIVEYWYREPYTETLLLLSDGRTVKKTDITPERAAEFEAQQLAILKTRDVQCYRVKMVIASGNAVLERADWAGSQFPFVVVYGEQMVIDGKLRWFGLTRFGKDPQKSYNYSRTLGVETVALAPQAKYWATPEQAKGHTDKWSEAHRKGYPFLLFNPDPMNPGAPQMMGGPQMPAAFVQEMQLASEDIKAVTGIYDASLGAKSNEQTGVAIRARQQQGEIAVFNYMDNLAKGIRRTWEILVDAIPHYYDTPRMIRTLGVDGAEDYVKINDGTRDVSRGRYDVTVTVGPSFSTQRQEAAEIYMGVLQANPEMMPIIGDLAFKAMDVPYADKVAERIKVMAPPAIQKLEQQDGKASPEVAAAMAQVDMAMQAVQQHGQLVQQAAQEAQSEKVEADKAKSDVQVAAANLKVQEANLKVQVAEFKAMVAETQAKFAEESQGKDAETAAAEREVLVQQVEQALQAINAQAAQYVAQSEAFMQQAAAMLEQIGQVAAQPVVIDRPTNQQVIARRVNGGFDGEVIDADTGKPLRKLSVRRNGAGLVGSASEVRS